MLDVTQGAGRGRHGLLRGLTQLVIVAFALLLVRPSPADAEQKKSPKSKSAKSKSKKPAPEASPTEPSAQPIASKVVLKPGAVDPESVDWGTVAAGAQPPPPKKEIAETPWSAKVGVGSGIDSNIDISPVRTGLNLLVGTSLNAQAILAKNVRIAALGVYEKNPGKDVPAASESQIFVGYIRVLPKNFQLRVSNLLSYGRERTVFADGTVLLDTTTLQTTVADDLAVLAALRIGAFDVEAGGEGTFEIHNGKIQNSTHLGIGGITALRYTFRDRASLRLRYSYTFSNSKGLTARNLAGGIDSQSVPLKVGLHRVRVAARLRISKGAQLLGRYDRVFATDDFSGFYDSRESVFFLGWLARSPRWNFEGNLQYARRFFTERLPTIDNPNRDTVWSATARVDFWPFFSRSVGPFAQYKFEIAKATPTGLLFERHIVLSGVSGRFGNKR